METPNMSYINSMSGGDKAFEAKIIGIIKSEFPEEKQVYVDQMSAGQFKPASESVHKLKHKISILGLEKSYEVAVAFEMNLLEGSTARQDEFEAILSNMTQFIERLN